MQTIIASFRRSTGLIIAGTLLAVPASRVLASDAPASDAFPDFESYIKVAGYAPFVTGDEKAFQARSQQSSAGSAGIEDLYYAKDLNDTTSLTFTGHAMAGTEDYLANVKIDKDKVGGIDAGFSRFRTFYDGVGGFFPQSNTFYKWSPEALHVDRTKGWIDLKLALPNKPAFTLSYHNETRTGMKDSSDWAAVVNPLATVTAGKLVGTALPANTPFVAPNVWILDEHHSSFDAGMVATLGNTTETLKLSEEHVNNNNQRSYVKYPNSNVIADPTVVVTDDQEAKVANVFHITNLTETKINDEWTFNTGFNYLHNSTTNGGNWLTPTYSASANAVYLADTAAAIYGTAKVDSFMGNLSLDYTPTKDWLFKFAYKQEQEVIGSAGGFTNTTLASNATSTAANFLTTNLEPTYSNYLNKAYTPELEVQFTGIKNVVLYADANMRVDHDNQHWINPYAAVSTSGLGVITTSGAPIGNVFFQEADQNNDYFKVGMNWNACSYFQLRGEVFRKDDQNQFTGQNNIVGTASYGAFYATGFDLTGAKVTLVLKPTATLKLTTRYVPQFGKMAVLGNAITGGTGYNEVTSANVKSQIVAESLSWTPTPQVYVEGNISVCYSYIQTAYPVVVVSTTTNIPTPIQNANNNYTTGSLVSGWVLDKSTDASLRVTYGYANNYNKYVEYGGQPYGSSYSEQSETLGLKHKFSNRLVGEARAGYLHRTDDTTGGFTNYKGPLVYVAFTYGL
jgi:hypothetical protein